MGGIERLGMAMDTPQVDLHFRFTVGSGMQEYLYYAFSKD